jgi:hypothetical protein
MVDAAAQRALLEQNDTKNRARLLSFALAYTGGWIIAPPIRALGSRIKPLHFRPLLRYRLGLPLDDRAVPCTLCNREATEELDIYGHHAASCQGVVGRSACHNCVRETLHGLALRAGLSTEREPLHLIPGQPKLKPADVLIHEWDGDRAICLDASIANPLTATSLPRSSQESGAASRAIERAKRRKHGQLCTDTDLSFSPVVMVTYEGFGSAASGRPLPPAPPTSSRTWPPPTSTTAFSSRASACDRDMRARADFPCLGCHCTPTGCLTRS